MPGLHGAAGFAIALALAGSGATPSQVRSKPGKPMQVMPAKKKKREPPADRSEGGARNGALEITLGSLTLGLSVVLIGRGAWELQQSQRAAELCQQNAVDPACSIGNPVRGGRIAAGVSFGLAVPIAVAGGFLVAYGAKIHRDWLRHRGRARSVAIVPWGRGVAIRARF